MDMIRLCGEDIAFYSGSDELTAPVRAIGGVGTISVLGRNTQGVRLMRVGEDSKVVCVARAEAEPEEAETVETGTEE